MASSSRNGSPMDGDDEALISVRSCALVEYIC